MATARGVQVRVLVVNHNETRAARDLCGRFRAFAEVVAIDSGSRLEPHERAWFDVCLPNVYYAGLFEASVAACADLGAHDVLAFVCSDVQVDEPDRLLSRVTSAFSDPRVFVYAPSATGGTFASMRNHGTGSLRHVPFVEGFCFAARLGLLRGMLPVDARHNPLGWGLDVDLAYRAYAAGKQVVVDDGVQVRHAAGSGYEHAQARAQMRAWLRTKPWRVRLSHALLLEPALHGELGSAFVRRLPWRLLGVRRRQSA